MRRSTIRRSTMRQRPTLPPTATNQQGIVLVASLLLLLIVTMLGLNAFRDIAIQEKVSNNFRMKTMTFVTANSAVQDQWPSMMIVQGTESLVDVRARAMNDDYDLDWDSDGTTDLDLTVAAEICYRGVDIAPGTDADFAAYLFEMTTQSSDPNGAVSRIRQSGYIIAEATDIVLPVSCP
jgi:Tfp pilus assembly protein PilX